VGWLQAGVGGVVFPKLSKLLNQEDALGATCLEGAQTFELINLIILLLSWVVAVRQRWVRAVPGTVDRIFGAANPKIEFGTRRWVATQSTISIGFLLCCRTGASHEVCLFLRTR
jgi:hypothetical protein